MLYLFSCNHRTKWVVSRLRRMLRSFCLSVLRGSITGNMDVPFLDNCQSTTSKGSGRSGEEFRSAATLSTVEPIGCLNNKKVIYRTNGLIDLVQWYFANTILTIKVCYPTPKTLIRSNSHSVLDIAACYCRRKVDLLYMRYTLEPANGYI
jgi:hypothetical protein